jgi:spore coat polysaccharide biosynthesis protein SpsF
MLRHVIERTARSSQVDRVVGATTTESQDDPVAELVSSLGFPVFRGAEHDVLDRYYRAAEEFEADIVVRNTGDCPFTDSDLIDSAVKVFRQIEPDYADHALGNRLLPRGVGGGVVSRQALTRAWQEAEASHHRSHVTSYIYSNPDAFELLRVPGPTTDYSHYRLTVDYPEDLEFARKLYDELEDEYASWGQIVSLLDEAPHIAEINKGVEQKALEEG